jgi:hypothetical protein
MNGHPLRPKLGLPDAEDVMTSATVTCLELPSLEAQASPRSPRCDSGRHGPGFCDCTASGAFVVMIGAS